MGHMAVIVGPHAVGWQVCDEADGEELPESMPAEFEGDAAIEDQWPCPMAALVCKS